MPLLSEIFISLETDLYRPSIKYEQLRKQLINALDDLEAALTKEQKQLLYKYWDIDGEMVSDREEQLFMFGYIMGVELAKESKK